MRFLLKIFFSLWLPMCYGQQSQTAGHASGEVTRPSIIFRAGEENAIQEAIERNSTLNRVHSAILKESADMLTESVPQRILVGRKLLAVARESRRKVIYLSYTWRMTREERFLKRAEAELLALASFSDWNPSHFLDVAEFTMACAIGLDWLHAGLSAETRTVIAKAIIEKGLMPSMLPENSKWLSFSNNWNQVCNSGMVLGALAVSDRIPDLSANIIRRSVRSVPLVMKEYEPDGGYPEGYGYWAYGTTFNVIMLSALEKLNNGNAVALNKGFLKTGEYLLHMAGPSGNAFNYSDNHPVMPANPAMFWLAAKNSDPSLLFQELQILRTDKKLHRVRELPFIMIWASELRFENLTAPSKKLWVGQGGNPVATLRSGWEDQALFVGFKGGAASYSHGHMDAGSFVLDALGERWASDLGPQNYHSIEKQGLRLWRYEQNADRWRVFRLSNHSHNTLTINNELHKADADIKIERVAERAGNLSCRADLTPLFGRRAQSIKRGIAVLGDNEVIIQDDLLLNEMGNVKWSMATAATVQIVSRNEARLTLNGKSITVYFEIPPGATIKTWSAVPPNRFDEPNPGYSFLGFETEIPAGKSEMFRVTFSINGLREPSKRAIIPVERWPWADL